MEKKSSMHSRTVKTAQILPPDANPYGTLFGGKLMAHIDDVAAISAMRHARKLVVTASTDSVDFIQPVKVGDTIILESIVTAAYRTSMEVFVSVVKEGLLTGEKKVCATAFLTFVALGENGKPDTVPEIFHETLLGDMLAEGAELRRNHRNERRKQSQEMAAMIDQQKE